MAWTTPRTWVNLEVPTAAIMNAHVRDNLQYLKDVLDGVQSQAVAFGSTLAARGAISVASETDGDPADLVTASASADVSAGGWTSRKARGNEIDSPGAGGLVLASDQIGNWAMQGWDGAAWRSAVHIRGAIDGTPGSDDMPGMLHFFTRPDGVAQSLTERLRINAAGQTLISDGTVSLPGLGWLSDPDTGLYRVGANDVALALGGFQSYHFETGGLTMQRSATAGGQQASYQVYCAGDATTNLPTVVLARARTSIAAPSIVSSGDVLGVIGFYGYDGAAYRGAATITAGVYATPGAGDMPTQLEFAVTADGSATPTQVFMLRSNAIGFYGTAPATKPTVTGSRGSNAALASLLTALAGLGLLTDSSS